MQTPRETQVIPFERMAQGPFAQLLRVPVDGFQWETEAEPVPVFSVGPNDPSETGPWLVDPAPMGAACALRQYAPMAVPNLHLRFARLKPTEPAILRFANRYGMLGHGRYLRVGSRPNSLFTTEPLTFWATGLRRVRMLVQLWRLVEAGDARELRRYVRWRTIGNAVELRLAFDARGLCPDAVDDGDLSPRLHPNAEYTQEVIAADLGGEDFADLLSRWTHDDPIEPARYFVHREVNHAMRGHVHPAVLPFRRGEIFFFPDCLLGAIYTHFALELSGRVRPAILCATPGCGRYFTPTRKNQTHCDPGCRKQKWADGHRARLRAGEA